MSLFIPISDPISEITKEKAASLPEARKEAEKGKDLLRGCPAIYQDPEPDHGENGKQSTERGRITVLGAP